MNFNFIKRKKDIDENIDESVENENKNSVPQGNFFKKKYLYIVFFIFAVFLILTIMRDELFSSKNKLENKNPITNEETNNTPPDLNADYGPPTDLEVNYDDRDTDFPEADENIIYQNELNQEEQDRLNRLKELEQEATVALRSPTTITIATRPRDNNSDLDLESKNIGIRQVQDYDGNRQESKKNFLMTESAQKFYQTNFLTDVLSEFELKAGHLIPAIMLTGINSDLPSKIITAIVSENVRDSVKGNNILIPQGTRIIGTYDSSITFGQERLLVIWQRLILPNGKSLSLDNMQGVDLSGQAGITGDVDNHFATLLKGVILSSFLGSVGTISTADKFGNDNWRTAMSQGAGEQITTIGERFAEKALSRQPTIVVRPGERFNIIVHSDLILEPYGE